MLNRFIVISSAAFLTTISACTVLPLPPSESGSDSGGDTGAEQSPECSQIRAETRTLLTEKCGGCHANGQTKGGLGVISDLERLIVQGYVEPGDSAGSKLYKVVESGQMPQGGEPLDQAELAAISSWIDTCAEIDQENADQSLADPPACLNNPILSHAEVLDTIRADISALDPVRAATTRYVIFSHLQSAGFCEEQMEGYRHAFAKLVNHLSLDPVIHVPVAIDEARTIYRMDLVDYGWTTATWATITAADPYAVDFKESDAQVIQNLAGTPLFSVKGDWFVESASQPPLYEQILELPETRFELEEKLKINVTQNIEDEKSLDRDEVLRAGFQRSGVSYSNRVVERHQLPDATYRGYWISYDFKQAASDPSINAFDKDITRNPLGFVADGGEIIFHLPNGLQAYMIVRANGTKIPRAPINVVHDQETLSEPEVINGLSCMSCHSEGMRLATDEIRDYVIQSHDFSTSDREAVAKLYTPADVFSEAQQRDIKTFADAMALTGAPRLVGEHEPVMAAHLAFDTELDLRRAAAEFGLTENELLTYIKGLDGLQQLDRFNVEREVFQSNFAVNACRLNLGSTKACPVEPVPN